MMHPRPRHTHDESQQNRNWSCLSLLVPVSAGSCDGYYWRFDWEAIHVQGGYGKKWNLVPQAVKEIPLSTQEGTIAAQLPPPWRKHYSHFMELVRALAGTPKMIDGLVPRSASSDYEKTVSKNPRALVSARFQEAVSHAKFVMWQKNGAKKLIPGLMLASEEMVPFALAAYNCVNPKGAHICERERCCKEFSSARKEQRFCSYRCRKAVQEQRRRDKIRNSKA